MDTKEYLRKVNEQDGLQKQYLETIGLLLLSIRGDWSDNESVKSRAKAALYLVDMIEDNCLCVSHEKELGMKLMKDLRESITNYITELDNEPNGFDGRYFRDNFPGGYMGILPNDFGGLEDERQ